MELNNDDEIGQTEFCVSHTESIYPQNLYNIWKVVFMIRVIRVHVQ